MTDLTPNLPEIVAEISALFERYEQALVDKDVDVLDASFWNSPHTIRYALGENGRSGSPSPTTSSCNGRIGTFRPNVTPAAWTAGPFWWH